MSIKLDQIDHKVLEILQQNAKITNAQLSKEIGLSPAPTLERVKKLELAGIIESYHAQLNRDKVGLGVTTFDRIFNFVCNFSNNVFLSNLQGQSKRD